MPRDNVNRTARAVILDYKLRGLCDEEIARRTRLSIANVHRHLQAEAQTRKIEGSADERPGH